MKALIYARVSSLRQVDEGHGLDSQEQRCRTYAKDNHHTIAKVFRDEGISGAIFERKGIKELFDFIANHPFEKYVVIVDDLSRIARDVKVHGLIREQLKKMEADLLCPNFQFDDTPEGELGEYLIASVNQYNRKANRRQVMQKMKARIESGHWAFCPPPGLTNQKNHQHGKILTPEEPIASIFKSAIEGYRDRILLTQLDVVTFIQEQYRLQNINRAISLHGVQRLLTELLYTGYLEYPKWEVTRRKGAHEGFITLETYEEVQRILNDRTKPKVRRDTNPEFPLRGLVLCQHCKKPMTASFNTSRNGQRYPNYFCKTNGCPFQNKIIRRKDLEENFVTLLHITKLDSTAINLASEVLTDVWSQQQAQAFDAQAAQERIKKDLLDQIEAVTMRIRKTKNETLISVYEEDLIKLYKTKESLEATHIPTGYTKEQFGTATKKVVDTLEDPVGMWRTEDLNDRLTVFFMHFDQKLVYDRKLGFGTATLAQPVELIRSLGSEKIHSVEMPSNELGSERAHRQHLQA